jgi:hypothetical protein
MSAFKKYRGAESNCDSKMPAQIRYFISKVKRVCWVMINNKCTCNFRIATTLEKFGLGEEGLVRGVACMPNRNCSFYWISLPSD